jgi:hypothetical protein
MNQIIYWRCWGYWTVEEIAQGREHEQSGNNAVPILGIINSPGITSNAFYPEHLRK